jgi:hypothetical protein
MQNTPYCVSYGVFLLAFEPVIKHAGFLEHVIAKFFHFQTFELIATHSFGFGSQV